MIKNGDLIQVNENGPEAWTGCILFVDEVKPWGVQAGMRIPKKGAAYIRLEEGEYDVLNGRAVLFPEDEDVKIE